ncbi:alpha-ribazole phosphatase [Enterococcus malodoratus]|uniref:histidine phosphatase family protein n=1 Tax=Enterococcus malodoratus TaxID=71451 RepID=UPI0008C13236|nr:histidine phosphatase family protein [Enterococcus malodoratus]SET49173.1 alpha-ribazole phosphatase [Enterococcus malodoratus]
MKIYLIRHGETEFNRRHLFYGTTDVSLNETGIQQAYLLREKFKKLALQAPVYTSELKRAIETAEYIFPTQTSISLEELNEKNFGLWEGLSADQINEKFPEEWERWLESPFEITPTNAEKYTDFQNRIWSCFKKLLRKNQDFVIVGHLGVLRVILKSCFPEFDFWNIVVEQGNYTMMEAEKDIFKIIAWNT